MSGVLDRLSKQAEKELISFVIEVVVRVIMHIML